MDMSPLIISLKTAFVATFITFFVGIYMACVVVRMKHFQGIMDAIITLPMVLPPTVVGFFLLLMFGKRSWLGQLLLQFDIRFVFSWEAAVTAAVVAPVTIRAGKNAKPAPPVKTPAAIEPAKIAPFLTIAAPAC